MRWSARTLILVGLGVGMAVSGTVVLRRSAPANTSARAWPQGAAPTTPGTPRDITALAAEVARLQADKEQLARLAGELQSDLAVLRSQLARVTRGQAASGRKLTHLAEKMSQAGSQATPVPARDEKAAATRSPEEERERAAARTQARIELLEGTMRTEQTDPEWASAAQQALRERFQSEAIPGMQLAEAQCRTTSCRMAFVLDGDAPDDNFRQLIHLAPWSGPSLTHIDPEAGVAVMYLAREQHALPRVTE